MISSMIHKPRKSVAIISFLVVAGLISLGMGSDEGGQESTNISGPEGEPTAAVDGTNNVSNNVSDNVSHNASNNASNNASVPAPNMTDQTSAEELNASLIDLGDLDNGTDMESWAGTVAIGSLSDGATEGEEAQVEVIGAGAGALEPTDLGALGGASEASAAGKVTDLSTLDEGTVVTSTTGAMGSVEVTVLGEGLNASAEKVTDLSAIGEEAAVASTTNLTEPMEVTALGEGLNASAEKVTDLSAIGEEAAVASTTNLTEQMDVRVLGNVLSTPPAEKVMDLSTLGNVTAAQPADETETGYASLSNPTPGGAQSTDVKDLSAVLGIEFSEVFEEA